jgi:hypothetical protein
MKDSNILTIGAVLIGYFVVTKFFPGPTSSGSGSTVNSACPRGASYDRDWFGSCDPNYETWLGQGFGPCVCETPGAAIV